VAVKRFYLLVKCLHFVINDTIAAGASKAKKSFEQNQTVL